LPQQQKQTQLDTGAPLARNIDDWIGLLPNGVYPTTHFEIVEVRSHVLMVKRMRSAHDKISSGQRRLYRALTSFGELPDAPGSVTVVVAWGMGDNMRKWVVFDHMGEHAPMEGTLQDYRAALRTWFSTHRKP
jgi:hypothetical protein